MPEKSSKDQGVHVHTLYFEADDPAQVAKWLSEGTNAGFVTTADLFLPGLTRKGVTVTVITRQDDDRKALYRAVFTLCKRLEIPGVGAVLDGSHAHVIQVKDGGVAVRWL